MTPETIEALNELASGWICIETSPSEISEFAEWICSESGSCHPEGLPLPQLSHGNVVEALMAYQAREREDAAKSVRIPEIDKIYDPADCELLHVGWPDVSWRSVQIPGDFYHLYRAPDATLWLHAHIHHPFFSSRRVDLGFAMTEERAAEFITDGEAALMRMDAEDGAWSRRCLRPPMSAMILG
jgi:hypothetical protein